MMPRASVGWNRVTVSLCLVLAMATSGLSAETSRGHSQQENLAFVHASVIPMDRERVLSDQTVVVREGRIIEIGPTRSTTVPKGFTTIDATDRFLIPALCDLHVHLLGEAWNIVFPPDAQIQATDLDMDSFLFPYVANGVATVQVLSATADHIALRDRIRQGEILGPRLILAQMIDGPDRAWPPPLSTWVASPAEASAAVLEAKEAGYDSMKVYSFLDQASYDSIVATARKVDMDVIGHVPMALSVEYVLQSRQRLIVHSEEVMKHAGGDYSRENIESLAEAIAESETWIVPTLVTSRYILALFDDLEGQLSRPEARYVQHPMQQGVRSFIVQNLYQPIPEEQRQWIRDGFEQFQLPFTKALHERGVKLLAGTDSGLPTLVAGFALHRELEEFVNIGLTPYEALRTSTTHPFEYLGELDVAGTVQVGKRADLVLLRANPLIDISNTQKIDGVMIQGRWLSGKRIEEGLASLADSHKVLSD